MGDPYEVLGVTPGATPDEVRRAYRELVRRHHPDRHIDVPPERRGRG
jgi:molecular chaperone DnaJ